MNAIKEWWEVQDASRQKIYMVLGALLAIFVLINMVPDRQPTAVAEKPAEVEVDLLNGDSGNADMNSVFAKIKVLEGENQKLRQNLVSNSKRLQQQQNALSAATQIAENPEQLGTIVNELNRMKEDLQELSENGVIRADGALAPPVQLVLGGETTSPDVEIQSDGTATISRTTTNPFSDVGDEGSIDPITSYDPLSAIKSSIEENTKPEQNDSGAFSFAQDKSFDRPPAKIVIEKSDPVQETSARTGGLRPGQTARDQRGELIGAMATPAIYIPTSSLFQGVLLNGMDAPTGSGSANEPYPATIRLTSLAFLPNRYTTNVRECFVLAAGFGRLDSERVHLRTETLSCVLHDGGIIDTPIQGYVTGEDGKVGLRGTVVERTGQLLLRAALAGLGTGFAEALRPRQIQSVQTGAQAGGIQFDAPDTGEVLEIGAYAGAAEALEKLSDFYLDRAEQIFPIIEIDALRTVTIHLQQGIRLDPVDNAMHGAMAANGAGK